MRTQLLWIFLLPALCRCEQTCTWLNSATAAGSLGGPVSAVVTATSCDFVEKLPPTARLHLEIAVMKDIHKEFPAWLARCKGARITVKAIGNEAVACESDGVEQMVGRVREQAFFIEMRLGSRSVTVEAMREKMRNLAEIVSGNLF